MFIISIFICSLSAFLCNTSRSLICRSIRWWKTSMFLVYPAYVAMPSEALHTAGLVRKRRDLRHVCSRQIWPWALHKSHLGTGEKSKIDLWIFLLLYGPLKHRYTILKNGANITCSCHIVSEFHKTFVFSLGFCEIFYMSFCCNFTTECVSGRISKSANIWRSLWARV